MPFGNLTGWHFLILLVVVLLVWGSTKLPALAESIGKSAKILKKELRSDDDAARGGTDRTGTGGDATSDQR